MRKKKGAFLEYAVYVLIIVFVLFIAPNYIVEKVLIDGTKTMVIPDITPERERGSITLRSTPKPLQPRSAAASTRR